MESSQHHRWPPWRQSQCKIVVPSPMHISISDLHMFAKVAAACKSLTIIPLSIHKRHRLQDGNFFKCTEKMKRNKYCNYKG
eukprot:1160727-Pelagomonas_calceolata.AAC.14